MNVVLITEEVSLIVFCTDLEFFFFLLIENYMLCTQIIRINKEVLCLEVLYNCYIKINVLG